MNRLGSVLREAVDLDNSIKHLETTVQILGKYLTIVHDVSKQL